MKKRRVYCSPVALALAALALGQAGGNQVVNTFPLPDPPVLAQDYSASFTGGCVLSLRAGSRRAAVSGTLEDGSNTSTLVRLSAKPYIADGVFYLPLEEAVRILGGNYQTDGDTITVTLSGRTAVYRLGQQRAEFNGRAETVHNGRFFPAGFPGNEAAVPLHKGGVCYLPLDFFHFLKDCNYDDAAGIVRLGSLAADDTLGPYSVAEDGRTLADFPTQGLERGELAGVLEDYGFGTRRYEGDGLTLYIFEELPGTGWDMDGQICGIEYTKRGTATPRGLQVGDTLDWASFLYAPLTDWGDGMYEAPIGGSNMLWLEAENGIVTFIGVYNRYWTPPRFAEKINQWYKEQNGVE